MIINTFNPSGGGESSPSNGWLKINGVLICWGRKTPTTGDYRDYYFDFPVAFSATPVIEIIPVYNGGSSYAIQVKSLTTTKCEFSMGGNYPSIAYEFLYIAIGPA